MLRCSTVLKKLQMKRCIFRKEWEVLENSPYVLPGDDEDIVEQVLHEGRNQHGKVIEGDDNAGDKGNDDADANVTQCDTITLVPQLERLSIKFGDVKSNAAELTQKLREFQVKLLHDDLLNSKQAPINSFFLHTT